MSVTAPSNGLSSYWEVENNPWIRRDNESSPNHPNSLVNTRDYEMQVLLCRNCRQNVSTSTKMSKGSRTNLSLSMEIKGHFLRFCESTSLRGVPRIVKTKEKKRKLLWIFFVLIFFIGCITCVVMIIRQYLRADVIHQPVTLTHKPRDFPSFTVCNTRPISQRGYELLRKHNLMNQVEYTKALFSKLHERNKALNFTSKDRTYLTMSMTLSSYLQALPKFILSQSLGHSEDEMIVECTAVVVDGNFNIIRRCNAIGNWTAIFNENFLNCYTFTVSNKTMSSTTKNINLLVYLGERSPVCGDCFQTLETQVDGVRVQLHETSTYPNVNEGGVYLSPGTLTEIQFVTKEWSMMQPPHGTCKKSQQKTIMLNNTNFRFTDTACSLVGKQRKVAERCNCTEFEKPILPEYKHMHDNEQFCRKPLMTVYKNMSDDIDLTKDYIYNKYITTVKCALTVEKEYQYRDLGCYSPCTYYTYGTSTSSTRWPTKAYYGTFFAKLQKSKDDRLSELCSKYLQIRAPRRRAHFRKFNQGCVNKIKRSKQWSPLMDHIIQIEKHYSAAISKRELLNLNGSGIDNFMKRMLVKEYVNNHFLTIQISRPNFDIIYIEEKAVISLTSLFSQVGGLLSIWVGLTFVCIVEIIELCLNVFETVSNKKK